jgi:hypothetical protein
MAPKGYRRRDDESVDSSSGPSRKRGAPDGGFYDGSSAKRSRRELRDDFGTTAREEYTTKIDFPSLPDEALREYMDKHDLVPPIFPSPASPFRPPPPKDLMNPPPMIPRLELSPTPSLGPTGGIPPPGRRRGDNRTSKDRRRSSRFLEEENGWKDMRIPILSDVEDAHNAIAVVCQRHYERELLRENDAITAFLFAVRNQGKGKCDQFILVSDGI